MADDEETFNTKLTLDVTNPTSGIIAYTAALTGLISLLGQTKAESSQAAEAITASMEKISVGVTSMTGAATPAMHNYQAAMAEAENQANSTAGSLTSVASATAATTTTTTAAATATGGFSDILGTVGTIASFVFGTVLGLSAIKVLKAIVEWFGQATQAAIDYNSAQFQLEVGVRAMQNSGFNVTIDGMKKHVEDLQEQFKLFSQPETERAFGIIALRMREFGFGDDKINSVAKMSAVLNLLAVNQESLSDTANKVTYAIDTGYFRSLQNYGVTINRAAIDTEALNLGFAGSYNALTPNQRALAAYNLILEQTNQLSEDAAKKADQLSGTLQKNKAEWENTSLMMGNILAPLKEITAIWGTVIAEDVQAALILVEKTVILIQTQIDQIISGRFFTHPITEMVAEIEKAQADAIEKITGKKDLLGNTVPDSTSSFEQRANDATPGMTSAFEQRLTDFEWFADKEQKARDDDAANYNKYKDTITDISKELADAVKKSDDEQLRIQDEFNQKSSDNEIKYAQKMEDIRLNLVQKLADISTKTSQAIDDENTSYAQKRAQQEEQADEAIAKAKRDHNQKIIDEEAKFQEKLKQMQEEFEFDLMGATKDRDARKILDLIAKYNMQRNQAIEDHELQKTSDNQSYEAQIKDLQQQKADRLSLLAQEHQQRLAAINLQNQREQAAANLNAERQRADLDIQKQRETDALKRWLDKQQADRVQAFNDQAKLIADQMARQYSITQSGALYIYNELLKMYGPSGMVNALYEELKKNIETKASDLGAKLRSMSTMNPNSPDKVKDDSNNYHFAAGGSLIASTPTTVTFGEAGPEQAVFTPLGLGGGANGKIAIQVLLSPDLEGRVVENSLGQMADILFELKGN